MNLIYLSPVPWEGFSQRPHELVEYFHHKTGGKVLWIDPYPTRLPVFSDLFRNSKKISPDSICKPDWLEIVRPRSLPVEPIPILNKLNFFVWKGIVSKIDKFGDKSTILGIGRPSALGVHLLTSGRYASSFFDAMDDFPEFYRGLSRRSMANMVENTLSLVSVVYTSSTYLRHLFSNKVGDIRLILNACAIQKMPVIPDTRTKFGENNAVIGYVGTVSDWFDWDLVINLALANPNSTVRIIGPVYKKPSRALPGNARIEKPLPHADALAIMSHFDVGLIPFKNTSLTKSVDPIKYYEYMAMGLPTISTAFGEMKLRGRDDGVCLVTADSDLSRVVEDAYSIKPAKSMIQEFRGRNSWTARFDQAGIFES